jgi:hypothetical protein
VRPRRLRFTLWQMMAAIAVVAAVLTTAHSLHLAASEDALDHENRSEGQALMTTPTGKACEYFEVLTPVSQHHARLKRTYELAALFPWIGLVVLGSLPLCARVLESTFLTSPRDARMF